MNGQQVLDRIILLKANRDRLSRDKFWRDYKRLRREFYQTPEWKRLSAKVRRGVKCACKRRCRAVHAHHIQGLFDRPDLGLCEGNLKAMCKKKHMRLEREKRSGGVHNRDARPRPTPISPPSPPNPAPTTLALGHLNG